MLDANADVKGLNIPDAMKRLMNNASLYTRLMKKFLAGGELEALKAALESRDVKDSAVAAHTMKGSAANLSAESIRVIALELEMSLKASEAVDERHFAMLSSVEEEYISLRAACKPYLED